MKAMDTGREPVSLLAMEQYEDIGVRLFQDEFAYRLLTPDMKVILMEDVSSEDIVSEEILKKRGLQCSEVERFVFAKKNG